MASDCIFCKIVSGEAPSEKLYETDHVLAFLDIAPVHKGHALVIPKVHYQTIFDFPAALGEDIITVMQIVGKAVMQTTGGTGLNVGQNNFRDAWQLVDHVHWHIIPRFAGDGLKLWSPQGYGSPEEMALLGRGIRDRITEGEHGGQICLGRR
ncbi:HIT family protein [Desulfovibrio ferrophilus]|uniref:Histidine triad protein n=1 Tax=Desulfovibrio ferrophilus TaxID=241368 RepID=A0A2Z6B262_9BACT|nr:HIT family protein [Desulfovibrio ferrophilus]BBD09496.1 histidine triad protein [Desulfovibrio ferrophilus]